MRLLTYNIRGGLGMDGRRSLERIAAVVLAQRPALVCFQEVHQRLPMSGFADQPRRLEFLLGMPLVFDRTVRLGFGNFGLAVATRLPILATRHHRLPSVGEPRGLLEVRVQASRGPVTVFCTHWGLSDAERVRQAEQTARRASEVGGPCVICGDFNERPDAAAVSLLLRETGFRDAGAGQAAPTYPADAPTARIDYVLYSPDLALTECRTVETGASDHRPLVAEFA